MTYELAKQLKDAGYTKSNAWLTTIAGQYVPAVPSHYNDGYFDTIPWPTLSELIEACEDFHSLTKLGTTSIIWEVSTWNKGIIARDSTMDGAVALAWLSLNQK